MPPAPPNANPPLVSREELLEFERDLPAMPASLARMVQLINDLDADRGEITVAISGDTAISSHILRLANSVLFAQSGQVRELGQAISVIGMTHVKTVVLNRASEIFQPGSLEYHRKVREHSLATGVAMLIAAERCGRRDGDQLFLYGLLHRLGQYVLLSHPATRDHFPAVVEHIRARQVDCLTAEMQVLGVSHAWIGGMLARRWNFPLDLVYVLLHYAEGGDGSDPAIDDITNLVRFADLIATASGHGVFEGHPVDQNQLFSLGRELNIFSDSRGSRLTEFLVELKEKWSAALAVWPA